MNRHTLLYQHNINYITLWDIFHSIYEFNASGCYGRPINALILLIYKGYYSIINTFYMY